MKTEALKSKIKAKFKTYSSFCRVAGLNRYEFQKNFLVKEEVSKEYYSEILALVGRSKDQPLRQPLTKAKIKSLRKALNEAGGVIAFCRENPSFPEQTVFQILAGRYPTISGAVQRLIDHFEPNQTKP